MPDSIRWLMSKGKYERAKNILVKRAQFNNVHDIPDNIFDPVEGTKQSNHLGFIESLKGILKHRKLLLRSLVISLHWFAAFIGYYGTLYASISLSGL